MVRSHIVAIAAAYMVLAAPVTAQPAPAPAPQRPWTWDVPATPASVILNPRTWSWPSSASDPEVRRLIIEGGYNQEELRNIRLQLDFLAQPILQASAEHPPDEQILTVPPGVKFGGRGFRGLEVPFGSNGYLYGSLPDRTNRILSIIAKGDRVWVIWLFTGHQAGRMFGAPPSGKELNVREMAMVRYKDGKLIEADYWGDDFALYSQLGGKVEFPGR